MSNAPSQNTPPVTLDYNEHIVGTYKQQTLALVINGLILSAVMGGFCYAFYFFCFRFNIDSDVVMWMLNLGLACLAFAPLYAVLRESKSVIYIMTSQRVLAVQNGPPLQTTTLCLTKNVRGVSLKPTIMKALTATDDVIFYLYNGEKVSWMNLEDGPRIVSDLKSTVPEAQFIQPGRFEQASSNPWAAFFMTGLEKPFNTKNVFWLLLPLALAVGDIAMWGKYKASGCTDFYSGYQSITMCDTESSRAGLWYVLMFLSLSVLFQSFFAAYYFGVLKRILTRKGT